MGFITTAALVGAGIAGATGGSMVGGALLAGGAAAGASALSKNGGSSSSNNAATNQSNALYAEAQKLGISPEVYQALHSTDAKTPSYFDTTLQSLLTEGAIAQGQYGLESQYAPKYAQLYQDVYNKSLLGEGGTLDTYEKSAPRIQELQNQLNTQQLQGNLSNLQTLGSGAMEAFNQANPELARLQGAMSEQAMMNRTPANLQAERVQSAPISGPTNATNDALQAFAQNQLSLGGRLDPQTEQNIINSTLSGFNTMGRAQDPMAIAKTALNLSDATQARQAQQFGYANLASGQQQGMQGLEQQTAATNQASSLQAQTTNAQNSLQAQSSNVSNQMQGAALQSQLLGGAYGAQMGTTMPALQMVLNPSGAINQANQAYSLGAGTPTSAQSFDPFGAGMGLFEDYTSLQANRETAAANKQSAIIGGGLAAAGSIFGAAL